jgi:hypothetical protein
VQNAPAPTLINQNQSQQKSSMGILDNLENAWDIDFQFESKPMSTTDNMGRPTEEPNLAVKLFSETCCTDCSCKSE